MLRLVAVVLLAWMIVPAGAQPPAAATPDPVIDFMTGRWEGTGTILGQPARAALEWTPVLDGRFARLTWLSHIGVAPKVQRFEGHAYYQRAAVGRAMWFDSSGMVRPIRAAIDDGALVATWGTPETELGETTYRRVGSDRLEVTDRVLGKNGEWREFGRSTLRRLP